MLKGSFNQADACFGDSRNRQCGAISLTAALKSKMKNVLTWTTQDLDGVLVAGTHLYESLSQVKSSHLYLYSAFNNTNCDKATAQYQNGKIVSIM